MRRLKPWPVIGAALIILIVGAACVIEMVTHPAYALSGSTFRAVVTLTGDSDGGTDHTICVGLGDPGGMGWTATQQGWQTIEGVNDSPSGVQGDAQPDPAAETDYNAVYPAFAPFRCWVKSVYHWTTVNRTNILFDINVPGNVAAGTHSFMWTHRTPSSASEPKTTSINILTEANVAVRVVDEAAGDNCANGGQAIISGWDADRDGIPDFELTTKYVCNGTKGGDGFNALVNVVTESAGDNCAAGGHKIETGLDDGSNGGTARNGVLEAGEVVATSYVCAGEDGADGQDGKNGFDALVNVTVEPEGDHCAAGGHKVETGLDNGAEGGVADNGLLEAGEVTNVAYVCHGIDGTNGEEGADGFNALVSVVTESAGDNCAAGGQKIETGLDDGSNGGTARNGVLEAGEVVATSYVCAGEDGAVGQDGKNGFEALVNVTVEPEGDHCTAGGQKVETGLDNGAEGGVADNGLLEAGEVTNVAYVCHGIDGTNGAGGADGYNALVSVVTESAGDNCAAGGQKIETGLDDGSNGSTARNGVLEAGEVVATSYVCAGENGADGEDGADGKDGKGGFDALVNITVEPEGDHCAAGGQKVETGLDNGAEGGVADNGRLEAGEVTNVAYVCHGEGGPGTTGNDGVNALVGVLAEPAGANCPAGGQRIVTGLDDGSNDGVARNARLEDGEIENTSYVCNAIPAESGCSTTGGLTLPFAILLLAGFFFRRSARIVC